jgi:hypothetical protein
MISGWPISISIWALKQDTVFVSLQFEDSFVILSANSYHNSGAWVLMEAGSCKLLYKFTLPSYWTCKGTSLMAGSLEKRYQTNEAQLKDGY